VFEAALPPNAAAEKLDQLGEPELAEALRAAPVRLNIEK
jgi:hypothetical protein